MDAPLPAAAARCAVKPAQARRKGLAAEAAVRDYLCGRGLVCERIPPGGADDRGDLILVDGDGDRWCLEVKHLANANEAIAEGLRELPREMEVSGAAWGAVVQRPPGKPDPSQWRVVMTLDQFADLCAVSTETEVTG